MNHVAGYLKSIKEEVESIINGRVIYRNLNGSSVLVTITKGAFSVIYPLDIERLSFQSIDMIVKDIIECYKIRMYQYHFRKEIEL